MNRPLRPARWAWLALTPWLSLAGPTLAQQAPAPTAAAEPPLIEVTGERARNPRTLITQDRPASVGKSSVPVQDTPFSLSVIDVEQIRETGAKNVQDALLYSAGVYAGRYGFDTRGDWAAVRGLSPASYIDGLRGIFGFYNNVRPEIYALSAVEVMRGPASALYGQADLGGIVNVVSKQPQATPLREVELQLGSYERKQIAADISGPLTADQTWLYRLVLLGRDSGTQVDHVSDDARLVMPSLTWRPRAGTSLTALFVHQANDTQVSSQFLPYKGTLGEAPLGQIPSSRFAGEPGWDRYDMRKNEFSLLLDHQLGADWKLFAGLRKTKSEAETREIYTTVGLIPTDAGDIGRTVHMADRRTDVLALDARIEGRFTLGPTQHTLAVGIEAQDALWEEFNYFNQNSVGSFNVYNPVYGNVGTLDLNKLPSVDRPDNKIVQTGVYVSDHMGWGPWILSLALRNDRARNETLPVSGAATVVRNNATTGRAGLMFKLPLGLSPYASYSEAFVPNLGNDGTPAAGFLKPTTGEQTEAGLKFLSASGQTVLNIAWFDIEQLNRIVDGSTPGGREQVGANTRGWELELRQRIGALELTGNLARMKAVNAATGLRLSSIAEETASAWATWRMAAGWRAGFGARYTGHVTGANGLPVLPTVSLLDAMVAWEGGPWDLRLDAKNLGDKTYVSWCRGANQDCGYGDRLNVNMTARYRF